MSTVHLGNFELTQSVFLREDSGRFLAAVHEGAAAAAWELADTLAGLAIANAPVKTSALVNSIRAYMVSATEGVAVATAAHAAPQEKGARAHDIPGSFGRGADYGYGSDRKPPQTFWHPGNPATRFMENAGKAVSVLSPMIVRQHMPGV
jgi:hypothetical protein